VVVAWSLRVFLNQVSQELSTLAAWLRLTYASMLGIALLNFTTILFLVRGEEYLTAFEADQVQALALLLINAFNGIWSAGLVVFGFHLLILGYLVYRSGYVPRVFGILLAAASLSYLTSNSASLLFSDYDRYKGAVDLFLSVPMVIGELGFGLWLLFKGGKQELASDSLHINVINNPKPII